MTPGAGAAAIAAAVLDPGEARFFGDAIVAAAAAGAAGATTTATVAAAADRRPSLAQLASRFRRAFPPGHTRFSASCAAALTLEATRRAPPPAALEPGQRAALWYCLRSAFPLNEGEEGAGAAAASATCAAAAHADAGSSSSSSSLALALNPFLPLMLRAVSSMASATGPALPERAYLLRLLASPPPPPPDGDGEGGAPPPPAAAPPAPPAAAAPRPLYEDLPPSAAVARVEAELAAAACERQVDAEALCERWRRAAAAAAAAGRARRGGPGGRCRPLLAAVPWQRPELRPLPPVPGELRCLYPPLPVEHHEQQPPSLFLWDGSMGGEDEDEEDEAEEDDEEDDDGDDDEEDARKQQQQQQQQPGPKHPPTITLPEARELVARALRGPLPPSQQQRVLAALDARSSSSSSSAPAPGRQQRRRRQRRPAGGPPLVARLGIEPEHVPLLVENVPNLAHGLLASAAVERPQSARGPELLAALAKAAPVTVSSLEIVHRLSSSALMPRPLLRAYVARCLAACEQLAGQGGGGGPGGGGLASSSSPLSPSMDGATARLVRLVCVFLTALVKSGALWNEAGVDIEEEEEENLLLCEDDTASPVAAAAAGAAAAVVAAAAAAAPTDDGDPLLHQLRAWCVSLSRVREAAALFQVLQAGA